MKNASFVSSALALLALLLSGLLAPNQLAAAFAIETQFMAKKATIAPSPALRGEPNDGRPCRDCDAASHGLCGPCPALSVGAAPSAERAPLLKEQQSEYAAPTVQRAHAPDPPPPKI
ncbi:MAG: hypothetical protein MRY74_09140 [Neomegalonema sp.]|nr:hypothetical protein [Neomegalonema sp.]